MNRLHGLRHTEAVRLLADGVPVKVLSELEGQWLADAVGIRRERSLKELDDRDCNRLGEVEFDGPSRQLAP
ncbi:hypothetical protein [Modestobacter lapidis]|nr:hypothetical protein [Modestobacter lapidis]